MYRSSVTNLDRSGVWLVASVDKDYTVAESARAFSRIECVGHAHGTFDFPLTWHFGICTLQ